MMTEKKFETALMNALYELEPGSSNYPFPDGSEVRDVNTFSGAGVLTRNKGLVVRLQNGDEFQLTIVQSNRSDREEEDDEEEECCPNCGRGNYNERRGCNCGY